MSSPDIDEFNKAYDLALTHCAEAVRLRLDTKSDLDLRTSLDALVREFLSARD